MTLIARPNLASKSHKLQLWLYCPSGPTWSLSRWPLPLPYLYKSNKTAVSTFRSRRSPWPHGLRHGSAVSRLLGLRFRIPPGAWASVSCECCVLSGRGLCDGPISYPEASTECGVPECDRETSIMMRPWHTGVCGPMAGGGGEVFSLWIYSINRTKVTGPSYGQQQNSLQCCHMACVWCSVGNKLSFHLSTKRHQHTASNLMFCWPCIAITWTNKVHFLLLIYFNNKPLHVSSRLAAHRQENRICGVPLRSCQQPVNTTHDCTNCCLYRVDPPDDGQQACSKHTEVNYWNKTNSKYFILFVHVIRIL
jgi:hypothetical protein